MIAAPMAPQQHPSQLTAEHRRSHHKIVEHGSAIVDRTGHARQQSAPAHQAALQAGLRGAGLISLTCNAGKKNATRCNSKQSNGRGHHQAEMVNGHSNAAQIQACLVAQRGRQRGIEVRLLGVLRAILRHLSSILSAAAGTRQGGR